MTVNIDQAQAQFADLIALAKAGTEVVITEDGKPVARLIAEKQAPTTAQPRVPGSAKGQLIILQEDDEHLNDFAEYME
jgi:prevent-host-death family protein